MKTVAALFVSILIVTGVTSCCSQHEFEKRKYTTGQYHDFLFGKENADKQCELQGAVTDTADIEADSTSQAASRGILGLCADTEVVNALLPAAPLLSLTHVSAARLNPQTYLKGTLIFTDSTPESVNAALSGGTFFTIAVGSAAATMVAPQLIWVSSIFIIAAPICLLISMIGGFIAYVQLATGKIDQRYRKLMRIWAIAMVLNVFFAMLIVFHFVA